MVITQKLLTLFPDRVTVSPCASQPRLAEFTRQGLLGFIAKVESKKLLQRELFIMAVLLHNPAVMLSDGKFTALEQHIPLKVKV